MMKRSGANVVVTPTMIQYASNTVLTSKTDVRLGTFTFVPD
jgi:hypothetical protein